MDDFDQRVYRELLDADGFDVHANIFGQALSRKLGLLLQRHIFLFGMVLCFISGVQAVLHTFVASRRPMWRATRYVPDRIHIMKKLYIMKN